MGLIDVHGGGGGGRRRRRTAVRQQQQHRAISCVTILCLVPLKSNEEEISDLIVFRLPVAAGDRLLHVLGELYEQQKGEPGGTSWGQPRLTCPVTAVCVRGLHGCSPWPTLSMAACVLICPHHEGPLLGVRAMFSYGHSYGFLCYHVGWAADTE